MRSQIKEWDRTQPNINKKEEFCQFSLYFWYGETQFTSKL